MIEPVSGELGRLALAGQSLFGVGLLVLIFAVMGGIRRGSGPNKAWSVLGGSLLLMGTVVIWMGRTAGGEVSGQVGAVPEWVLVVTLFMVFALFVVRMLARQDRTMGSALSTDAQAPVLLVFMGVLLAIYAIPVAFTAWKYSNPSVGSADEETFELAHEVRRAQRDLPEASQTTGLTVLAGEGSELVELVLRCRMRTLAVPFAEGKASVDELPVGPCLLYLPPAQRPFDGLREGDELTCTIAEDSAECGGGWLDRHMGQLSVIAELPGYVRVGGGQRFPLPLHEHSVRPDVHRVEVMVGDLESAWQVEVGEGEAVVVEVTRAMVGE